MFDNEWVRFGDARERVGFAAWPARATAPLPAIIVIQEAWGVDGHIEDLTIRFAKAGYLALAPDLFAENGERPEALSKVRMKALKEFLNQLPPTAWGDPKARDDAFARLAEPRRTELAESFATVFGTLLPHIDSYVPKLVEATNYLRSEHPLSRGAKVGSVGYCMGGTLSARLACADANLGAAVIYYGSAPPGGEVAKIACPLLGLYGALDARVSAGIPEFAATMQRHQKSYEYHVYEGAYHAFFNDTRPSYNAKASRDAFARTLDFFRRVL